MSSSSSPAPGGAVDSRSVVTPIVAAIRAAKTGHATLGGAVKGSEDFQLGAGIRSSISASGMQLQLLEVGSVIYLKGFPGTTKWLKIDTKGSSPIAKAMSSAGDLSKSSDPSTLLLLLADAKASRVGTETVSGKATTHYHFVVPPSAYAKAMGSGVLANAIKDPVSLDLWVDSGHLPVTATSTAKAAGRTVTTKISYSDWGKPVNISAPPASEVTTKTPF
jgi:hypothetical protein